MKLFQTILVVLVMLFNLAIAQPSFAERTPVTSSPDYIAITEELAEATDPAEIAKLQFERYLVETGKSYGECKNLTDAPLVVYGNKSKYDQSTFDNGLYTLPSGKTTDGGWNCQGVYLANGLSNDGQPTAIKIVTGTKLVAKTNLETGAVELNIPAAKIFQPGEANWSIPATPEEFAALTLPKAPLD